MAITYHAGRRIQGTSTDATPIQGGWVELGRTTLGSTTEPITVSSLPDKRYYMVLTYVLPNSGRACTTRRLGSGSVDTGTSYSSRRSDNGASDATNTSRTHTDNVNINTDSTPQFCIDYCSNLSSKEKLGQTLMVLQNTAGAGNAPSRAESVWKWTNTSNPLDIYQIKREPSESADWLSGSECVVLGWDPDDTHTTNFWEELADVTNSGGSTNNFGTGSFIAKKYLWVQAFVKNDGVVEPRIRVGTGGSIDTGTNIVSRMSSNGGSDGTATSRDDMVVSISSTSENHFINMFMVNNASNEKLAIHNCISVGTAGAGTAPQRREGVSKYTNTSAQVNIIEIEDNSGGSGGIADGTFIKVWGSN